MCGHGTIGLIASLAWLGRIQPGKHLIETPVGDVTATLHEDGSVSVENVPAYRWRKQVQVETVHGTVTGDIARAATGSSLSTIIRSRSRRKRS